MCRQLHFVCGCAPRVFRVCPGCARAATNYTVPICGLLSGITDGRPDALDSPRPRLDIARAAADSYINMSAA